MKELRFPVVIALLVLCNCEKPASELDEEGNESGLRGTDATASASPSSSTAAAPTNPYAGEWTSAFSAQRTQPTLSPQVPDPWKEDEGESAIGDGTVTLTIGEAGSVNGQAKGALGDLTIAGELVEDSLRATLTPRSAESEPAMYGTLIGELKGEVIAAEIRVADGRATTVRNAKLELKKRAPSGD